MHAIKVRSIPFTVEFCESLDIFNLAEIRKAHKSGGRSFNQADLFFVLLRLHERATVGSNCQRPADEEDNDADVCIEWGLNWCLGEISDNLPKMLVLGYFCAHCENHSKSVQIS